ncbi:MAG: FIST N-terminal domain-containing protein [Chromatiaceae bacterium]
MKTQQIQISDLAELAPALATLASPATAQLALLFGARELLGEPEFFAHIKAACPQALIVGCSTAGEITRSGIADNTAVLTLAQFDQVELTVATTDLADMEDSLAAGQRLGAQLQAMKPRALVILGQGLAINGSALIDGLRQVLGDGVTLTGGLAGDGNQFLETLVMTPQGPSSKAIVALGLGGEALRFNHGSFGGWEPFGTLRKMTKAVGNVLYELDGKPALDIYKAYLGDYAKDLPSSGLYFPFEVLDASRGTTGVIRTILAINEAEGSLTLAGDVNPEGYLQLMHASTDQLISGAETAAFATRDMAPHPDAGIGILVSCVGRRLVMGYRIDEEIEAVGDILGQDTVLTGFYSYGELSPFAPGTPCLLQNQTMTIIWIAEAP